ncbi:MAG: helix-turn-helix domain-containing protein [Vicinamibacterales bacterium]|nr:helix-turn-helix domain-containing protein [Vicinamibacterales bacterium]
MLLQLFVRLEKATFGPVLRAARERRGVSLRQMAAETKISVELWAALEENNLERWPRQVFARSYVRDYAERVGLDADEVVNEFCRLFPEWGDRRAEKLMRGHADIVSHKLEWEDLPAPERRRASDRASHEAPGFFSRHRTRVLAVIYDLKVTIGLGALGAFFNFGFWPSLGVGAVAYIVISTALAGRSFGLIASEWTLRALKSWPATRRRLVSSRVQGA